MAGSTDYVNDGSPDADSFAVLPVVFRYDPGADDPKKRYTALPNVRCLSVEFFEGARPPEARFRYAFGDDFAEDSDPERFEQVIALDSSGPRIVNGDDRLVVRVYWDDGEWEVIFDGFAQAPQADVSGSQEQATFLAFGTPVREWDEPCAGAVYRDGDDPQTGQDVVTGRNARFNPEGKPNCTPYGYDHGADTRTDTDVTDDQTFPVFMDERIKRAPDAQRAWTVATAARYVMFGRILHGVVIDEWVKFHAPETYDNLLDGRKAVPDPDGPIDPGDSTTYTDDPITLNDLDVLGDRWPDALEKVIKPHGFNFRFYLETDADGDPEWWVGLYRLDDTQPTVTVKLAAPADDGSPVALDLTQSDAAALTIQRDTRSIVNCFTADTKLTRYEIAVVLAPGFAISAGDASSLDNFVVGKDTFDPVKYRVFVADETGDGHWDFGANDWLDGVPLDLEDVLGKPDDKGNPTYSVLRRPGEGHLLTLDERGERRETELHVSTNYAGEVPGLWDGTGDWQQVTMGGWDMLDDRLGVRLTRPDLEGWNISKPWPSDSGKPFPGGSVRVVTSLANPNASGETTTPRFYFLLVTVIEGDSGIDAVADRRASSPTEFQVRRRTDNRGWFEKRVVHKSSPYAADEKTTTVRDDTDAANAHVRAMRAANELGTMAGSFTVRRFTMAYQVGDRLTGVEGRGVDLRQNLSPGGEKPIYPAIVSLRWDFDKKQETVCAFNDRRADPPPERRR